jgi:hypothetical protein
MADEVTAAFDEEDVVLASRPGPLRRLDCRRASGESITP